MEGLFDREPVSFARRAVPATKGNHKKTLNFDSSLLSPPASSCQQQGTTGRMNGSPLPRAPQPGHQPSSGPNGRM